MEGIEFELYGNELQPEAPPFSGNGRLGLVWDGPELSTCGGDFGAYLAYNTPHKASMYLAKGLPVLVSRGAAVAAVIAEHDAGILINSLHELPGVLQALTQERYAELQAHAARLGEKIRSGHFVQAAAARLIASVNP